MDESKPWYLLHVCDIELERASSVNDCLKGRVRVKDVVEGIWLCNVLDKCEFELSAAELGAGEGCLELVGFLLTTDGGDDGVPAMVSQVSW